jgi:hypothetical protein
MERPPKKINVLFIIKPERGAGAEMVLVEAAKRLHPDRSRVICGLLTPDAEQVIPPHLPTVDFRLPGLNGPIWVRFFFHLVRKVQSSRFKVQGSKSRARAGMNFS